MIILKSVDSLLEHLKAVQEDVIAMSNTSMLKITSFIEKNELTVDDDMGEALQYQDIMTQQLNATIEAIENMRNSIQRFNHAFESDESLAQESLKKLQDKLDSTLEEAKEKKDRFSGKMSSEDDIGDEIEFF